MPSLQFNQQTIFTQGDQVSTLYKLTQGSVTLLNQEVPIAQVQAPYYLNLLEHIYGVPALKTVRAYDKCLIQKIRKPTETHKAALRTWKEKGFRKSKFQIFEELHAALFYELLRYGTIVEISKQNSLPALQDQIYLVADGTLEASGGHPTLRCLSLASGETIVASNPHTYLHAVSERAILMAIPISTAKVLLGDQFNTIE